MSIKIRERAPLWVFLVHEVQQRIRNTVTRNTVSNFLCKFKKKNKTEINKVCAEKLNKDGFLMIEDVLSAEDITVLIQKLSALDCVDRVRKSLGTFNISEVPEQTHVADINNVVDVPEAIKFANNEQVLALVEGYLGAEPIIDSIKAWWSLPGFDEAENEQYYHRDNDSIKFIKLFMYLTDVDDQNGPHIFIKGSQSSRLFEERRRFTDNEVEQCFAKEDRVEYQGKLGTTFLEDTYGIHKGSLPISQKRLLIQVRYSLMPTIFLNKFGTDNPDSVALMKNSNVNKYLKV